jgi:hypothetical protein
MRRRKWRRVRNRKHKEDDNEDSEKKGKYEKGELR